MNRDQLLTTATAIFVEAIRYNGRYLWHDRSCNDIMADIVNIDNGFAMELAKQSTHMAIMLHDAVDTAVNDIPKEE